MCAIDQENVCPTCRRFVAVKLCKSGIHAGHYALTCINKRGCSFFHPFTTAEAEAAIVNRWLPPGWSPLLKSMPTSTLSSSSSLPVPSFPSQQPMQVLSKRSTGVPCPGPCVSGKRNVSCKHPDGPLCLHCCTSAGGCAFKPHTAPVAPPSATSKAPDMEYPRLRLPTPQFSPPPLPPSVVQTMSDMNRDVGIFLAGVDQVHNELEDLQRVIAEQKKILAETSSRSPSPVLSTIPSTSSSPSSFFSSLSEASSSTSLSSTPMSSSSGTRCEAYKTLVYERNIYAKLCEWGSTLSKDPYNRHKKSTSTLVERLQITRTQGKCTSDE
ncbi:hypothetical protein VNI00_018971 [Paramarasmius palmivorus]|uniref:Uncharacterized protein n=1 Tax=Paramarasmius palmivorus TaxID=297713 RepID=A0AAW0AU76_9AGAR